MFQRKLSQPRLKTILIFLIFSREYHSALDDLEIASKLCPTNSDLKKLKNKINEEINMTNSSTLRSKDKVGAKSQPLD